MSLNDSSTGGFLAPVGTQPPEGASLDAIFQQLVVGITGIDGTMVRPRWQAVPPKEPTITTDWAALGITERRPDANPTIRHHKDDLDMGGGQTSHGYDESIRHEEIVLLCSFYGPNAHANAERLRDGLWVSQNRETLFAQQISFFGVAPARILPDLVNEQNRMRIDVEMRFRRAITRLYPIENLLEAVGSIENDLSHVAEPIDTANHR